MTQHDTAQHPKEVQATADPEVLGPLDHVVTETENLRTTRSLWQIEEDLTALEDLLDEAEGEITGVEQAVTDWFTELGAERDKKLDNYCAYIRELQARANVRYVEASRINRLARRDEQLASYLKARVKDHLEGSGIKRLDLARHRLSVCGNGGAQSMDVLVHPEELPERFRVVTVVCQANPEAIRAALEAGDKEAAGIAVLKPRGTHLRIT